MNLLERWGFRRMNFKSHGYRNTADTKSERLTPKEALAGFNPMPAVDTDENALNDIWQRSRHLSWGCGCFCVGGIVAGMGLCLYGMAATENPWALFAGLTAIGVSILLILLGRVVDALFPVFMRLIEQHVKKE